MKRITTAAIALLVILACLFTACNKEPWTADYAAPEWMFGAWNHTVMGSSLNGSNDSLGDAVIFTRSDVTFASFGTLLAHPYLTSYKQRTSVGSYEIEYVIGEGDDATTYYYLFIKTPDSDRLEVNYEVNGKLQLGTTYFRMS